MNRYTRLARLAAPLLVMILVACGPSRSNAPVNDPTPPSLATPTTLASAPGTPPPSTLPGTPPSSTPSPGTPPPSTPPPATPSPRASLSGTATRAQSATPIAATPARTTPAAPLGPFALSPTPTGACFGAGFIAPDPRTFTELMPAVLEYLYYRKRAFISGEMGEFLDRYPALRTGADAASGINDEARQVALYKQTFTLIDGDIDPEHYERMTVRRNGASAEVIIHMLEIYLLEDFSITGSEVRLKLALQQTADGGWTVVRTDALTDGELARERQQCH